MALVADIETREWRHCYNIDNSIPLEHARASTTDDVECFFSVLKDTVGKDFTLQEVNTYQPAKLFNIVYLYLSSGFLWLEEGDSGVVEENGSQSTLLLPYINQHRESCLNLTKCQLKNLGLSIFSSMNYWALVIGSLWLFVVPHQYAPSFTMCH